MEKKRLPLPELKQLTSLDEAKETINNFLDLVKDGHGVDAVQAWRLLH